MPIFVHHSSFGSKGPPEGENYTHQRLHPTPITLTPTATERPKLEQNKNRDVSESKSVTPTAARSTRPAGPTEPPFIGEAYMSGDAPQQTVSSFQDQIPRQRQLAVFDLSNIYNQ